MTKNKDMFKFVLPLDLSGFPPNSKWYGGLRFRSQSSEALDSQYEKFRRRVISSIGREYLPVYRMADGEFGFMVGGRSVTRDSSSLVRNVVNNARIRIRGGSQRTCWGEVYTQSEIDRARSAFNRSLKKVAVRGLLAAYFAVRGDGWSEAYFEPVCNWLDANGITLTERNYIPFYFAYALLSDPRRRELYEGRRVVVVTHLDAERQIAIERALFAEGVSSVEFIPVSPDKALLDSIDTTALVHPVDLALVGAGIGSVNVLAQLESLKTTCIDCGIVIECMLDFSRRTERPFLLGDDRLVTVAR